jgi:hypothetical protein
MITLESIDWSAINQAISGILETKKNRERERVEEVEK